MWSIEGLLPTSDICVVGPITPYPSSHVRSAGLMLFHASTSFCIRRVEIRLYVRPRVIV